MAQTTAHRWCKYGAGCTRFGCYFKHPPERLNDCHFGASCNRPDCIFRHPRAAASAVPAVPAVVRHEEPGRVVTERKVIEACLCFDTTGSMYPYLEEVRAGLAELVRGLVRVANENSTDLRIGIIAHGDYCDKKDKYVIKYMPLMDVGSTKVKQAKLDSNLKAIMDFTRTVGPTYGGDPEEAYELALHKAAQEMDWGPNSRRLMVMVGDDLPHEPGYVTGEGFKITMDWKRALATLVQKKVRIYSVQAENRRTVKDKITAFWQKLADDTGGRRLDVSDMETVPDLMVLAVAREMGDKAFQACTRRIQDRRGGGAFRGELAAGYRLIETVEVVTRRVVVAGGAGAGPATGGAKYHETVERRVRHIAHAGGPSHAVGRHDVRRIAHAGGPSHAVGRHDVRRIAHAGGHPSAAHHHHHHHHGGHGPRAPRPAIEAGPVTRVHLGGFAAGAKAASIRAAMGTFGTVTSIKEDSLDRGYTFVTFADPRVAASALRAGRVDIPGAGTAHINAPKGHAPPHPGPTPAGSDNRVFVGGIGKGTKVLDVLSAMGAFGKVESIDEDTMPKGFTFVTFAAAGGARRAIEAGLVDIQGAGTASIRVPKAPAPKFHPKPKPKPKPKPRPAGDAKRVFVGGIKGARAGDLIAAMERAFGVVESIDEDTMGRGFTFVTFTDAGSASRAVRAGAVPIPGVGSAGVEACKTTAAGGAGGKRKRTRKRAGSDSSRGSSVAEGRNKKVIDRKGGGEGPVGAGAGAESGVEHGFGIAAPAPAPAAEPPLPEGWTKHVGEDGLAYFYNAATGESQWDRPIA